MVSQFFGCHKTAAQYYNQAFGNMGKGGLLWTSIISFFLQCDQPFEREIKWIRPHFNLLSKNSLIMDQTVIVSYGEELIGETSSENKTH